MFNVTISFNPNNENIREETVKRLTAARAAFFDELVKDGLIEELKEEGGHVTFRVTFGGTQEFLSKLPKVVWHFRVLDKKARITLEAVPAL